MSYSTRSWVIPKHGGPEVLEMEEGVTPEPGPNEVRVRMRRGALNHMDIWMRRGVPGMKIHLPLIPMCDGMGVIDKIGDGVVHHSEGDRVVLLPCRSCGSCKHCVAGEDPYCEKFGIRGETFNGYASETVVVPVSEAFTLPDTIDDDTAGCFGLVFLTAYRMVFTRGQAKPNEWVLVHAAGSGVSSAAIALLKMIGARIIATTGSDTKVEAAHEMGVEHVINYNEADFAEEVKKICGKVDLVIDHVGGDSFACNVRSLAKGGRLVTCGATKGLDADMQLAHVFYKGLSILGSTMGSRAEFMKCIDIVGRGMAKPIVGKKFTFDEYPQATDFLEQRKAFGKVVIEFPEEE
ncbi:MAG TPA: zinc-binding dehydrogenase [bacterium]